MLRMVCPGGMVTAAVWNNYGDQLFATRRGPIPCSSLAQASNDRLRHANRVLAQPVSNGTLINGSDRLWRNIQAPSTRA